MAAPTTAIDRYDPARYNVLLPTPQLRQQLGAWHQLTVSEVSVNPDPAAGDVYPLNRDDSDGGASGPLALAKPALYRIAVAGGIIWDPQLCRFERLDDVVALYRAVGYLRMPDGSILPIPESKLIDLRVVAQEERMRLERRARERKELRSDKERQAWVERRWQAVMVQWRKAYAARAETGAMLRVIRAAFAIKAAYAAEELRKPFVVPRIDFAPDMNDPEVRRWVLTRGSEALRAFGWTPARPAGTPVPTSFEPEPMRPALTAPPDEEWADEAPAGSHPEADATEPAQSAPSEPAPEPAQPAQPEPAPEAAEPQAGADDRPRCQQCGRPLSPKVHAYSMEHYGQPLCMQHQPRRRDED